jgi:hypothetical protein
MAKTTIPGGYIEAGSIDTASLADTSITADKLHTTLDLTGKTITVATATAGDNDTTVASTAFVSTAIANLAPLASPDFTGDATFDTDTLVIDSTNNNVGIGTSSPNSDTTLTISAANNQIDLISTNNSQASINFVNSGGISRQGFIKYEHDGDFSGNMQFRVAGSEAARIDSSGNVGIGVVPKTWNSAWDALQIGASGSIFGIASGNENMSIASNAYLATDGNYKYIATNEASQYIQSAGVHYFRNVASGTADTNITWNDRMIIDSSGNLLVDTTSSNYGAVGSQLGVGGNNYMTRSGANPLLLNRLSSDGAILSLMKDGAPIGSIGTFGGTTYYASNSHGFLINGTQIEPSNNTGGRLDNTVDIGSPTYRFKNLILSGGVYLGGTGAANKLDDYEEGTWTPSFSTGSWSTVANFTYTKIGRLVHVTGYLASPSNAPAGNLIISGFPFPGNDNYNMFPLWYAGSASTAAYAYMAANQTSITVRPVTGGVNTMSELSVQMVYTTT